MENRRAIFILLAICLTGSMAAGQEANPQFVERQENEIPISPDLGDGDGVTTDLPEDETTTVVSGDADAQGGEAKIIFINALNVEW